MKFELGKYYKHTSDKAIYICGVVHSHMYGMGYIAEDHKAEFSQVGSDSGSAENYNEITKEDFFEITGYEHGRMSDGKKVRPDHWDSCSRSRIDKSSHEGLFWCAECGSYIEGNFEDQL